MTKGRVYMDTSFVLSHLHVDGHTEEARKWTERLSGPGVISPLVRLEFHNMLWRKVGHDGFERGHADEIISEFEEQIEGGWFFLEPVDQDCLDERAMGLTRLYAQELKVRALDILHVALALELGVRSFWTFDLRQRKLAERVGFKVGPAGSSR